MQRALAMPCKDNWPIWRDIGDEAVKRSQHISIGRNKRLIGGGFAGEERAEGRLPVSRCPYIACRRKCASLTAHEQGGAIIGVAVVERGIPGSAIEIRGWVDEEYCRFASGLRGNPGGEPERGIAINIRPSDPQIARSIGVDGGGRLHTEFR